MQIILKKLLLPKKRPNNALYHQIVILMYFTRHLHTLILRFISFFMSSFLQRLPPKILGRRFQVLFGVFFSRWRCFLAKLTAFVVVFLKMKNRKSKNNRMIELCLPAYSRNICSTLGALLPSVDQTFNIKLSALVGLRTDENRDPFFKSISGKCFAFRGTSLCRDSI